MSKSCQFKKSVDINKLIICVKNGAKQPLLNKKYICTKTTFASNDGNHYKHFAELSLI